MMQFQLTPEQAALKDSVARFVQREYGFEHRTALLRSAEGFSRAHWTAFAELGWLGAGLSEDKGGYGGGTVENALILEELARGLVLEPILACAVGALQLLAALPPSETVEALIAQIVGGETIAVLAHGEVDDRLAARAEPSPEGWRLRGGKRFVLSGAAADLFLVTATTPDGAIGVFSVARGAPGLTITDYRAVDGRRVCDLAFEDLLLPADARLSSDSDASPAVETALDHLTIGLCAEALGAMDTALWLTRDYLKTRKQFGVTLNTFQALQHRMADMLVETELARSMLLYGVAALSEPDALKRAKAVSAAKAQIGEAGYFVCADAIQLHGGIGVTEEYAVGHFYKRLVLVRNLLGHTDEHLARFARLSRGGNERTLG
jgi:alkylation response protein AidB-like acyl-CoA dehydrogenase